MLNIGAEPVDIVYEQYWASLRLLKPVDDSLDTVNSDACFSGNIHHGVAAVELSDSLETGCLT